MPNENIDNKIIVIFIPVLFSIYCNDYDNSFKPYFF